MQIKGIVNRFEQTG